MCIYLYAQSAYRMDNTGIPLIVQIIIYQFS